MRNDPGAYRRFIRAALYEKIVYWPCQIEFFSGTKEAQSISAEFTMKIRFWAFSARLVWSRRGNRSEILQRLLVANLRVET